MRTSVRTSSNPGGAWAVIIGILLLIEGIWGFFSPLVFGVLSTNYLHATIHVVLGLVGLWAGSSGHARGFLQGLGILLVVVGIFWFVPGSRYRVEELLNVNQAVAAVNVIVGAICLLVAGRTRRMEFVETLR